MSEEITKKLEKISTILSDTAAGINMPNPHTNTPQYATATVDVVKNLVNQIQGLQNENMPAGGYGGNCDLQGGKHKRKSSKKKRKSSKRKH